MYRQQAERLAEKLKGRNSQWAVEVYVDGMSSRQWMVNIFDPRTQSMATFDCETDALSSLAQDFGDRRLRA